MKEQSTLLNPSDVAVFKVCDSIVIFRDGTLISERDSLGRKNGVVFAQGLFGSLRAEGIEWKPSAFSFSLADSEQIVFEAGGEDFGVEWLLAGVILGERTSRVINRNGILTIENGRSQDLAFSIEIWKNWLEWRRRGSRIAFYKYMGYDPKSQKGISQRVVLEKQLGRMGLSSEM